MKFNHGSLLALILITVLMYVSCRKVDTLPQDQLTLNPQEEIFFNSHRTSDPTEKKLVEFIKRKNDKLHFVEKTAKQIGFPRWDKALTKKNPLINGRSSSDSITITYVPFVRDSQNYVNAAMIIKTSPSDSSFTYACDWQYSQFQNSTTAISDTAEYFAIFFMTLDENVFGYNRFKIIDTSLFKRKNHKSDYITLKTANKNGRSSLQEVERCQDVYIYYLDCTYYDDPDVDDCRPECDECSLCYASYPYQYCWTEYIYDNSTGSTGGTTGGGGGGSTGGGGDGTPPDCGGIEERTILVEGCESGWQPYYYNYSEFMASINTWSDLESLNASLGDLPVNTEDLRTFGRMMQWDVGVSAVQFNRRVGKAFEATALKFYDLPPHCQPLDAPKRGERNTANGGLPSRVIPDALTAAIYYKDEGRYLPPTIQYLGGHILTEVKAYNGTLELSTNRWQILGELEVLTRNAGTTNPPSNKRPLLFFVTTSNTVIGQSIIDEAASRGIMVWQAKAVYDPVLSSLSFSVPVMLNFTPNPGVDKAPRSYLGTQYIAGPVPIQDPPSDCDQTDPEEIVF